MSRRRGFTVVLLVLVLGGVAAVLGEIEEGVSFSSVLEVWADVLRDTDQFGLRLTRVSDAAEMRFGTDLARGMVSAWGESPEWTRYVSAVGHTLLPHRRRQGIRYEFHAVRSNAVNAFALPGGQIFVLTGLLEFLQSEAELAAILGHEMSHVDLRHCIERYQYQLALKRIGAGELGDAVEMARQLLTVAYTKYQEVEADAQGVRMSVEAGYDPQAGVTVFSRLAARFGEQTPRRSRTPVGEVAQAMEEALGSYFTSHPSSEERMRRLENLVTKNHWRLKGQLVYSGIQNYRERIPRSDHEFPGEQSRL